MIQFILDRLARFKVVTYNLIKARTGHLGIDNDIGRKKFVIKDGPKKD